MHASHRISTLFWSIRTVEGYFSVKAIWIESWGNLNH